MNISTILEEEENISSYVSLFRTSSTLSIRPRRMRKNELIRSLIRETRLHKSDLICPLFVQKSGEKKSEIKSLPTIFRYSIEGLLFKIEELMQAGLFTFALFPVISVQDKSADGREAYNPNGLLPQAIEAIKKRFPNCCLISDVALDAYTDHGHDGLINSSGEILNDESVESLIKMAIVQAAAGVDMIAPSDMMDGRVGAIRQALDKKGFTQVIIHSYAVKYASALYSPYREALHARLAFGDKRSYQMDPANYREASREALLDEQEGADILMVKPATFYLDIIAKLRSQTVLPISAFQVSGEYSMMRAAAQNGWLDFDQVLMESLIAIKRAGANMIFTYGASRAAELLE